MLANRLPPVHSAFSTLHFAFTFSAGQTGEVRTNLPFVARGYVLFVVGQKVPKSRVKGLCPLTYPDAAARFRFELPAAEPRNSQARAGSVGRLTLAFAASK